MTNWSRRFKLYILLSLHPNRNLLILSLYEPMENHLKCFPRFPLEIHDFLQSYHAYFVSHIYAYAYIYAEIFILITEQHPNHVIRGFLSPRIKVRTD